MMLDYYFRRPIFWDYFVSSGIAVGAYFFYNVEGQLLDLQVMFGLVSELTTISLTLAGFVVTLLTVLISFKSADEITDDNIDSNDSTFQIFFKTQIYFETVKHLRNAAGSLTFIGILGFGLKLVVHNNTALHLTVFNFLGLSILLLTLVRCLIILSSIIKMQAKPEKD